MEYFLNGHGSLVAHDFAVEHNIRPDVTIPANTNVILYSYDHSLLGATRVIDILRMHREMRVLSFEDRLSYMEKKYAEKNQSFYAKVMRNSSDGSKIKNQIFSCIKDSSFELESMKIGKSLFPHQYLTCRDIKKSYTFKRHHLPKKTEDKYFFTLDQLVDMFKGQTIHILSCRAGENENAQLVSFDTSINRLIGGIIDYTGMVTHLPNPIRKKIKNLEKYCVYNHQSLKYMSMYLYRSKNAISQAIEQQCWDIISLLRIEMMKDTNIEFLELVEDKLQKLISLVKIKLKPKRINTCFLHDLV